MELFIAGVVLVGLLVLVFKRKRPEDAKGVANGVMQNEASQAPQGMWLDPTLLAELGRQQVQALIDKQQSRGTAGRSRGPARGPDEDEPQPDHLPN